jgi:hypothetical protein
LEELENWPVLRHSDVGGFEKFAELVRVTVVKLKAEIDIRNLEKALCTVNWSRNYPVNS